MSDMPSSSPSTTIVPTPIITLTPTYSYPGCGYFNDKGDFVSSECDPCGYYTAELGFIVTSCYTPPPQQEQPPVQQQQQTGGHKVPTGIIAVIIGVVVIAVLVFILQAIKNSQRQLSSPSPQQRRVQRDQPPRTSVERSPPPAAAVIPEAERRRKLKAHLQHVSTKDIVIVGDGTIPTDSTNNMNIHNFNPTCAICLSDFVTDDSISGSENPDCRHYFHTECILQAFLKQPTRTNHFECPICRREFVTLPPTE